MGAVYWTWHDVMLAEKKNYMQRDDAIQNGCVTDQKWVGRRPSFFACLARARRPHHRRPLRRRRLQCCFGRR